MLFSWYRNDAFGAVLSTGVFVSVGCIRRDLHRIPCFARRKKQVQRGFGFYSVAAHVVSMPSVVAI